jgi:hypothetical protein
MAATQITPHSVQPSVCGGFASQELLLRSLALASCLSQLTEEIHVASDHHLIWADLDIA